MNADALANINKVPIGAMLNDPTGDVNKYRPLTQWQTLTVQSHDSRRTTTALQTYVGRSSRENQRHLGLYMVEGNGHNERQL